MPLVSTLRRVGHKGADLIAPGNTLASFDAALEAGVDMIEFDVLPERGGDRLVLAHDYSRVDGAPTLEEGLAHFASAAYTGVELDVDLKLPGYEVRVLEALRSFGLLERALISTQYVASLRALRAAEPGVRLGWSVPRLRRDPTRHPVTALPAYVALGAYRARLPARAAAAVRAGLCDALMAHWKLVTPRLLRAVQGAGGELFVWTVDDPRAIRRFAELGVTGVITNDPRLFSPAM
ncbi:MAG: glycerophosphodiester phosphodiesterase [Actinomycetota bacterium]|nr:glycerophosphodiester phosphodiesterase [Actinomycetota bacterium]